MSKKPTDKEVAKEIAALKALKPTGRWADKTANSIRIMVDALNGCIDETSDEFTSEMSEEDQMTALDAINWKEGNTQDKPSKGWGGLAT